MLKHLINLANKLDQNHQYRQANQVDVLIYKIAQVVLSPKELTPAEELAKANRKLTPEEQAIVDKDQTEKANRSQAKQEYQPDSTQAQQAHQAVLNRMKNKQQG